MDDLRWVLLAIGIAFVVAIYFWSRARKSNSEFSSYQYTDETPSFSATENNDGWVDGVGPVRVVKSFDDDELDSFKIDDDSSVAENFQAKETKISTTTPSESVESKNLEPKVLESETTEPESVEPETAEPEAKDEEKQPVDDVIVLYLVAPRGEELKGEQILSSTFATQLEYGDMNIFHRKDANNKTLFSLTNMMEPGWFEIDKMHEMKTRGISLFVQLSLCDDPVKVLDDMLVCAHTLSSMLNAQLCDQNRQLLNESYTAALREKAKGFA